METLRRRVNSPVDIVEIRLLAGAVTPAAPAAPTLEPRPQTPPPDELARREGLRELAKENADLVGWIAIADTQVDCPVMQSVQRPWYYLDHDFSRKKSKGGTPFIDEACDLAGNRANWILYGHNMKNGSMFGGLHRLADAAFYNAHRMLRFDTPERAGEYRIVSVFYMAVGDEETFQFYRYPNLPDAAAFDAYAAGIQKNALYPADTALTFGDELLTLVTCSKHAEQGRLVAVAKRVRPPS